MYLIVLLHNYKHTYDQIDQIEKLIRALYRELVLFLRSKKSFCYILENESEQDILGWNTSLGLPLYIFTLDSSMSEINTPSFSFSINGMAQSEATSGPV